MTLFWLNDGQMSLLLVKIISAGRKMAKLRSRLVIFLTIYEFGDEIDCGL